MRGSHPVIFRSAFCNGADKWRHATDGDAAVLLLRCLCANFEEAFAITLRHEIFSRDIIDFRQKAGDGLSSFVRQDQI